MFRASDGDTPKPVLKERKAVEDEVQEESDGNTDAFNATTSGDEEKGKLNWIELNWIA